MSDVDKILEATGVLSLQTVDARPMNVDTSGPARHVPVGINPGTGIVDYKLEGDKADLQNVAADGARLGLKPQTDISDSSHKFSQSALTANHWTHHRPDAATQHKGPIAQSTHRRLANRLPAAVHRLNHHKLKVEAAQKVEPTKQKHASELGIDTRLINAARAIASGNPMKIAKEVVGDLPAPLLAAAKQKMPSVAQAYGKWEAYLASGSYTTAPKVSQQG